MTTELSVDAWFPLWIVTPEGRFTVGELPNVEPEIVTCTLVAPSAIVSGEMPVIVGDCTGNDVEPIVKVPSEFEADAVRVAVPADSPLTITVVLCVNVPKGLTTAAGPEMEREMGVVLLGGVTVALIEAV